MTLIFGFQLFRALLDSIDDQLVTTTYLDKALARQSKEFDEKLTRQTQEFKEQLAWQSKEFDEKLARQTQGFKEQLAQQAQEFDNKLRRQTEELKQFIDRKLGYIAGRWGEKVEANYRWENPAC